MNKPSYNAYKAFGLNIESEIPLPGLEQGESPADVVIRYRDALYEGAPGTPDQTLEIVGDSAHIFSDVSGTISVIGGREIVVDPVPGIETSTLQSYLIGLVFAVLLHQRGYSVLHGSAISIEGRAVLFLGNSGAGKSTLAGAFHRQGKPLVSDDVTPVDCTAGQIMVLPGCPYLKLWPGSVNLLQYDLSSLPAILHNRAKRRLNTNNFSQDPVPLGQIYILANEDCVQLTTLTPREALLELVRHSHSGEWLDATKNYSHFLSCSRIANTVSIKRLAVQHTPEALERAMELVGEDLRLLTAKANSHSPSTVGSVN